MKTKSLGFSLIETIVAITIGGIILATVMGSFLSLSRMRQQLDLTRQIQREINFAVIRIADRIRSQEIDYPIGEEDKHTLPLEDTTFSYDQDKKVLSMNESPLFSSNLKVDDLTFTITPTRKDPSEQPFVTIELQVSDTNEKTSVPLRTTISSRLIQ